MTNYDARSCDYCGCSISIGQHWVREKIYQAPRPNELPAYRHFHAESFEAQQLSCWEGYWMERELAPKAVRVGGAGTVQTAAFVS